MGDQDIDFRLNTQADPAGADEIISKLDELKERAEAVREGYEELDEQKRQAEEEEQKRAAAAEERQTRGIAQIGAISRALVEYGALMKDNAKDVDFLSDSQKEFVAGIGEAAQLVGSLGTAFEEGAEKGGPLVGVLYAAADAYKQIAGAAKEADAAINDSEAASARAVEMWTAFQNLKKTLPMVEGLEQVNKLLDEELEKLVRNERVRQAASRADSAESQGANAAAVAAGTKTQGQADAANLGDSFKQQAAAILETLRIAATGQAAVEAEVNKLTGASGAGVVLEGFATLDAQLKATEAKQAEVVAGAKRLEDNTKIALEQIRELDAKGQSSAREIGEAGLQALTEVVTTERDALRAEVDRLGSRASTGARSALAILDQILADGQLRADEVAKYNQSIGLLNRNQELNNAAVLAAFDEGRKLSAAYGTEIVGVKRDLGLLAASFRQQIDALKQQSSFNQSGY